MKNKSNIVLILIVILSAFSIFQGNGIRKDVIGYKEKIESIQRDIDSIRKENDKLNKQILMIDNNINKVDGQIIDVTKNINILKKQTNEKIDSVNNFNFSDLEKFFSDRYKDKY